MFCAEWYIRIFRENLGTGLQYNENGFFSAKMGTLPTFLIIPIPEMVV